MRTMRGDQPFARVCSRLDAEWRKMASSSKGRSAVQRWVDQEPALASASSGEEVVALCHRRDGDTAGEVADERQAALRALLRLAAQDEFAERTVMQAMLPGLLAMGRRLSYMVASGSGRWADQDELEQEIVATAYERVRALAGTSQAWPARTLLEQTRGRLRALYDNERRWRAHSVAMTPEYAETMADRAEHSAAEELAHVVVDAVQDGTLAPGPAGLLYTCGVLGREVRSVASAAGWSRWTVSDSIARSAHVLAAAS